MPERIGDQAGMLAARAAEAGQRVARDVMAARDRDLADRVGHVVDRDAQEALGDFVARCVVRAPLERDRPPRCSRAARRRRIERLVAARAEHRREMLRHDPAEEQVAVGDGQRSAAAVAGRPRLRAGACPGRPGSACRRSGRSTRRPPRRCGSASSARGCARRRPCFRRPARSGRHNATRRSRCRPCRSRSAARSCGALPRPCRRRRPPGRTGSRPCRGMRCASVRPPFDCMN